MIKSIDQWVDKYRVDFDFQANSTFVEATDYYIQLVDNVSDQQSALIKCACGVRSSLSRHGNNGHYSVSRRTVHLLSSEGFSARDRKHSPRRRLCFLTHSREGRSEVHLWGSLMRISALEFLSASGTTFMFDDDRKAQQANDSRG